MPTTLSKQPKDSQALRVRQAWVSGQIVPGVPVWRLGAESKYPDLPYIVFPGDVGGLDARARVLAILTGVGAQERDHIASGV